MPLTKFADRINTTADRAFLATCRCQGDVCSCRDFSDDQPLTLSASNNSNKETSEMSFINRMSAAERTKLADTIAAANEHMTIDERRDLVDTLTVALAGDLKTKSANDKRHEILSRIHAAETDVAGGGKAAIQYTNNLLRRSGVVESVQELAFLRAPEVDKILASATKKLDSTERMGVKRVLGRLGWQ